MSTLETPVTRFIDTLFAEQEKRHAWIPQAAEQIRRWREEDRKNGQPWETIK